jgi:hypothetical protein
MQDDCECKAIVDVMAWYGTMLHGTARHEMYDFAKAIAGQAGQQSIVNGQDRWSGRSDLK